MPTKPSRTDDADAQLTRQRVHFDLAERAARFGYWRVELGDGALYWSPGMYRILGVDPAVQPPDNEWLLAQMRPDDRLTVHRAVATAIKTRSPFSYRSHTLSPIPAAQIVDTHGEVAIGEDGRVTAIIGVCHDVTQQVRAEEAREKAQHMYRVMTEEASDIILFYDGRGHIQFASQALERLLGRNVAEIEKGRFAKLVHPEDRHQASLILMKPAPGETITATFRVRHAAGHYVWIEVTTRAIYDSVSGKLRNLVSVSRDVSERKLRELEISAAQQRAEAANRAKSQFLANMSHELRTPLNAVIGFTDLMRRGIFGPLGNERYEQYATLIYDSGQLLLDLISDMLDMAKIEAGKLDLNIERLDLRETIEDIIRLVADRAAKSDLTLQFAAPSERVALMADRRAVKQVLLNLITNAIKFTLPGGRVDIRLSTDKSRAILAIRDTGIGIAAQDMPRIGKPFEQVCADPMLAKSGTGLGLALVRALMEKHGGALRIDSQEGIGTEVRVDFPLAPMIRAVA